MEDLKALIKAAQKDKRLLSIRRKHHDWDTNSMGYVVRVGNAHFSLKEIDKYGLSSKNTLISYNDIIDVSWNDRYSKRLNLLKEKRVFKKKPVAKTIYNKNGLQLQRALTNLKNEKCICTFFFHDYYVTGFLKDFTNNSMTIENIGHEGDTDGTSFHQSKYLEKIRKDGFEEKRISILLENASSFYN